MLATGRPRHCRADGRDLPARVHLASWESHSFVRGMSGVRASFALLCRQADVESSARHVCSACPDMCFIVPHTFSRVFFTRVVQRICVPASGGAASASHFEQQQERKAATLESRAAKRSAWRAKLQMQVRAGISPAKLKAFDDTAASKYLRVHAARTSDTALPR